MDTLKLWRWHLPDRNGKLKPSRWRMTEENAQARHPGCKRVEGSLEVRNGVPRDASHSFHSGLVLREDGAMVPPGCSSPAARLGRRSVAGGLFLGKHSPTSWRSNFSNERRNSVVALA